jgi:serine/threonine-protein kinase HipA
MSRIGKVIYQTDFAGIISEDEDGYHFQYDAQYLNMANAQAISLTITLQNKLLNSNILF